MNRARAMLDALMGPGRDELPKDEEQEKNKFKDKTVCKGFLIGFCPLDPTLLGGKRTFTGGCSRIHSVIMCDQLKVHPDCASLTKEYEALSLQDLEFVIRECETHITAEKQRIQADIRRKKPPLPLHINDRLSGMKREATALIAKAEAMDDDQTREKEALTSKANELLKDREELLDVETKKAAEALDPELVCDICGTAYVGKDGDAAHLKFRIHDAYTQVRERIKELKPKVDEFDKQRREKRDEETKKKRKEEFEKAEGGDKKRSRSKKRDGSRGKDDDKEKAKEKDGDKERSRRRSGSRDKDRSRRREPSKGRGKARSSSRKRSPSRKRGGSRKNGRSRSRRGGAGGRSRRDDSRSRRRR